MSQFQKGQGGRVKGSRNKLSMAFVEALSKAFDARGEEAIRIVIDERPQEFLKIIAAIVPKELEITDSRLKDLPDEQLDALIEFARGRLADGLGNVEGGEDKTIN